MTSDFMLPSNKQQFLKETDVSHMGEIFKKLYFRLVGSLSIVNRKFSNILKITVYRTKFKLILAFMLCKLFKTI